MSPQFTALEPVHTVLFLAQGFCLIYILVALLHSGCLTFPPGFQRYVDLRL